MTSLRDAIELLKEANKRFPPKKKQHHGLHLNEDGQLVLTLMLGDKWQSFVIEEEDLDCDPEDLMDGIVEMRCDQHG